MKKAVTIIMSVLLVAIMALGLCACGGDKSPLKFDKSELDIFVGDNYTLTTTLDDAPLSSNMTVDWNSTDKTVATVTNGRINALKAGTTTITAEVMQGTSIVSASCEVNVTVDESKLLQYELEKHESEGNPTTLTGYAALRFYSGNKLKIQFAHQGFEAEVETTYTAAGQSVSASVASVTLNANDYGQTIMQVLGMLGIQMEDKCYVDNLQVKLAANYLTLEGTLYLTKETYDSKTGGELNTFASFTMTAADATKLGITLAEKVDVESITLDNMTDDKTKLDLVTGEQRAVKITVAPETATIATYKLTTSDATVATIDAKGIITAVGVGTATITATAVDNATKTATLTINVTAPAAGVKLVKGSVPSVDNAPLPGSFGTMTFKNDGKVNINAVYFVTAFNFDADYTLSNGNVSFTNTEATVTTIDWTTFQPVSVTYTITFTVSKLEAYTVVSVTAVEKDKAEAAPMEIATIILTNDADIAALG